MSQEDHQYWSGQGKSAPKTSIEVAEETQRWKSGNRRAMRELVSLLLAMWEHDGTTLSKDEFINMVEMMEE